MSGIVGLTSWYYLLEPTEEVVLPRKTVAYLIERDNEVSIRTANTNVSETSLTIGEKIYRGDLVSTKNDSSATIRLVASSVLDVDENSTILFDMNDNAIDLRLTRGGLYYRGANENKKDVYLSIGQYKQYLIELNDAEFSLSQINRGEYLLNVNSDNFFMWVGNKSMPVAKGSSRVITAREFKELENQISVKTLDRYFYLKENEPLTLRWEPLRGNYNYILETENKNGQFVVTKNFSGSNVGSVKFFPPQKTFKWRLKALPTQKGQQQRVSQTFRVSIDKIVNPNGISPIVGQPIYLSDGKSTRFRVDNFQLLQKPRIEIANDPSFNSKVASLKINERKFADYNFTRTGRYFWRVIGYFKQKRTYLKSPTYNVSVLTSKPNIRRVELKFPYENERIPYRDASKRGIILGWDHVGGAKAYEINVAGWYNPENKRRGQESDWVLNTTSSNGGTNYVLTNLRPGLYTWQITAMNGTRKLLNSEERLFLVNPPRKRGRVKITRTKARPNGRRTASTKASSKSLNKNNKKANLKASKEADKKKKIKAPKILIKVGD